MQIVRFFAAAVAFGASVSSGYAQAARPRGPGLPPPMKVSVPAYSDGGAIPSTYGCAGGKQGVSPTIHWSGAPDGTQSFTLILHDTDLMIGADDVLHWAIFNVPGTATGLPEAVPNKDRLDDGSQQLTNIGRSQGYFNPCPPPPTVHHYIMEIFAVDSKLDSSINNRADLMKALAGHVKAKGTYIGTYHQ